MQLVSAAIEGFRRFETRAQIRLEGRLIAFIGPNEAGKSSVLDALSLLNNDQPIPDRDITRGMKSRSSISATFLLDEDDRKNLADLPGGSKVRKCVIRKRARGPVRAELTPDLSHDASGRTKLLGELEGVEKLRALRAAHKDRKIQYTTEDVSTVRKALKVDRPFFNSDEVEAIRTLAYEFQGIAENLDGEEGSRLTHCTEQLAQLADHEENPYPLVAARRILDQRPRFLKFDEEARMLPSAVPLDQAAEKQTKAISNLLHLARLDLAEVLNARANNRPSDFKPLEDEANATLADAFQRNWVREKVTPVIHIYEDELRLHVKDFDGVRMRPVDERSDGLRWFTAMLAFVNAELSQTAKPILLVDEAETHLSYDAQANLVQVLSDQQIAQMVLYTTHSAGCLPSDLGTGIRYVKPADDEERSEIINSFWHDDPEHPGFTSLMLAMGASALAFTPARNVVVGEGASECILLPTLLRQATGNSSLEFQVAPGLSNASKATLPVLLDSGARVSFLCDADKGGADRKKWLERSGANEESMVAYDDPEVDLEVETIEDLLAEDVYIEAVNRLLERYDITDKRLDESRVPDKGRSRALKTWFRRRQLDPGRLQKPLVCQEAVSIALGEDGEIRTIVESGHKEGLKRLHDRLVESLKETTRPTHTGGS